MPTKGWTTISFPKEMVEKIKKIIKEHPELGYKSVSDFIIDAIRKHPHYMDRLEHFNIYPEENRVTLWDHELKRLVDVTFGPKPPYVICELCGRSDCIHVQFVLKIPKVVQSLRERGWRINEDESKIIYVPNQDIT